MSDQKTDTDQTPAPDLTDQLDRMEEQLIVLRAHTTPPRRNMTLPIAATAGALALLGLLVHRLIVIDHATQQQRSAQTQLSGKVQAALRNAATQRQKTADRLATLDALPKQLSTQLQKRTEAVTRHGELERRMGKLEAELEALRTKLAQSEDSRSRLATQVLFLTQQNRALSLQRELLLKRVGGDVAEGAKPAHSGRSNQTKPMSADLNKLLARINSMLQDDGREKLVKLVTASGFVGGRFSDVYLEERTASKKLRQRIWAASATIELHVKHRLLRIRLGNCRREFSKGERRESQENRLPEITVELYDVNVKGWKELSGAWLTIR